MPDVHVSIIVIFFKKLGSTFVIKPKILAEYLTARSFRGKLHVLPNFRGFVVNFKNTGMKMKIMPNLRRGRFDNFAFFYC